MKNFFTFSSVGSDLDFDYKQKVFSSWDINFYDSGCVNFKINDKFPYTKYFCDVLHHQGSKFLNLFYFQKKYNIYNQYKYFAIIDDDLFFDQPNTLNSIINLMEIYDIGLASPSNNGFGKDSYYNIMQTSSIKNNAIWITNFCEMGCMIMRQDLLKLIHNKYIHNRYQFIDWGFDRFISRVANNNNIRIGIVKNLTFFNPEQPIRDYGIKEYNKYKKHIKYIDPQIKEIIEI